MLLSSAAELPLGVRLSNVYSRKVVSFLLSSKCLFKKISVTRIVIGVTVAAVMISATIS